MPRHTRRSAAAAAAAENTEPAGSNSPAEPVSKRAKTVQVIAVGDKIPDGEVQKQDGTSVNLAEEYSKGVLVLYAYPKASTPGCTRQTLGFGAALADFEKLGATVFGISADSTTAQTTFKTKTGVDFDILSDTQFTLLEPLGAKKSPKGVIRSHWVFVDGTAVLVEHQVKPDSSPQVALDAVKSALSSPDGDKTKVEEEVASDVASSKPEDPEEIAKQPEEKLADAPAEASAEDTASAEGEADTAEPGHAEGAATVEDESSKEARPNNDIEETTDGRLNGTGSDKTDATTEASTKGP